MKAVVNTYFFNLALRLVMPCVSKDESRLLLTYISGRAIDGKVVLMACDAFRLAEYRFKAEVEQDGFFWINPRVRMFLPCESITISADETTTTIDNGACAYRFKNLKEKPLDAEKLFADDRGQTKEIGFNPRFLSDTLKPLSRLSHGAVQLSVGDANKATVITCTGDEGYRGMVLPIRIWGNRSTSST